MHAGRRDSDFYLVAAHTDAVLTYKKFDSQFRNGEQRDWDASG